MSEAGLREAIPPGALIVLDTSVVLAYLNGTDAVSPPATLILDELIAPGINPAAISAITVTETLVRPFRLSPGAVGVAETFLQHFANMTLINVDFAVAREAGRVRAITGLKTPDAIVIASALLLGGLVVSNDDRWQAAVAKLDASLQFCHLDAYLPL